MSDPLGPRPEQPSGAAGPFGPDIAPAIAPEAAARARKSRIGRWLKGIFGTGHAGETDPSRDPPESIPAAAPQSSSLAETSAAPDRPPFGGALEAGGPDTLPESPEDRIRAEQALLALEAPAARSLEEDPALAERIEELEDALRAREQDLRVIRGELEAMGRERGWDMPAEPLQGEPSALGLESPSIDSDSSGAFRIPALAEREALPGHAARTRELFEARERELRAERDRMQAELARLREELEHRLARLEGERDSALADVDAYRGKYEELERATGELRSEIARERESLARAREAAAQARSAEGELERLQRELGESRTALDALEEERRSLVATLADREQALAAAEATSRNLAIALHEAEVRGERFAEERLSAFQSNAEGSIENLRLRVVAAEGIGAELTGRLAAAEAVRDQLAHELQEARETALGELERVRGEAAREIEAARASSAAEMEEVLGGLDELRVEFEKAEEELFRRIQGQTREIGRLQSELAGREGELEAAVAREQQAVVELTRLRQQSGLERAETQRELALQVDRSAALQRERDGIAQALAEKSALAAALDTKFHERTDAARELQAQVARLKAAAEERIAELKKAAAEREVDLGQARGELETRNRELAEARSRLAQSEQRMRELEGKIAAVSTEKEAREREYVATRTRLETQQSELRASVEDRDQRIAFLQAQSNRTEARAIEMEEQTREATRRLETRSAEFREAFDKKQEEARRASESLAAREQEFRRFATELQSRDRVRAAEIERLEAKIKEKDSEVNELLKLMESKTDTLQAAETARSQALERMTALEQRGRALEERSQANEKRARDAEGRLASFEPRWKAAEEKTREIEQARHQAEERLQVVEHKYRGAEQAARGALERAATLDQKLRLADERVQTLAHDLDARNKRIHELEIALGDLESIRRSTDELAQLRAERDSAESARAMDGELIARLRETLAEREAELRKSQAEAEELESTKTELMARLLTEKEEHGELRERIDTRNVRQRRLLGPIAALPAAARTALLVALAALAAVSGFYLVSGLTRRSPDLAVSELGLAVGPAAAALPLAGSEDAQRARQLVTSWAQGIERRDWKGLIALYEPGYVPANLPDRKAFEAETIETLRTAEWLAVDQERLEVRRAPDGRLVAVFPLELRTRGHLAFGRRELWLVPAGEKLLIADERWASAL